RSVKRAGGFSLATKRRRLVDWPDTALWEITPALSPSVYRCVRLRTVYGVLVHNRSFGSKASLVSRDMFPRLPLPLRRRCSPVLCYPAPAIGVWFDRSPLKMAQLTMINEFTRECLAIRVARRSNSHDVIERLGECMPWHGAPEHVRSDNWAEMAAERVRKRFLTA